MTTSREYTDLNVLIPDAFNTYMLQNCPFYSGYQYNSSSDIIVQLSEDINEARGQAMDSLVEAYVDPPVFYSFSYNKNALTPSETIVDGSDSGIFTPLTNLKAINYNDGCLINTMIVTVQTLQIDGPSTSNAALTLKLRDLTNQVDITSSQAIPSGVETSDGGLVFDVILTDLSGSMPAVQADWELSASIQGNISVKSCGVQTQYSVMQTPSNDQ